MKKLIYLLLVVFTVAACTGNNNKNISTGDQTGGTQKEEQLNISILLDLSDRISPEKNPATPDHFQRDIENVKIITEFFKSNMEYLGAFKAKGKIRAFFSPPPKNPGINTIASVLNIDCSKMDNKGRKEVYDTITSIFSTNLHDIYSQTISTSEWEGSDIWRFFKDDVKDFCIEKDSIYRNILIIFTDGYMYHKQSLYNNNNRYSYLLNGNLSTYRKPNWEQLIEQNDFGIITEREDLHNLEVLVLEINAEQPNNKIDEDIISHLWKKWFTEMNVSRSEVYRSDLPANTKTRIENFLKLN